MLVCFVLAAFTFGRLYFNGKLNVVYLKPEILAKLFYLIY